MQGMRLGLFFPTHFPNAGPFNEMPFLLPYQCLGAVVENQLAMGLLFNFLFPFDLFVYPYGNITL